MTGPPTAESVVAGVIGDPIRHSRSPAILNAAFQASGLGWTYVAFEVAAGDGAAAADAVRTLRLGGLSVTMPHKSDVIPALDGLTEDAERLGAVNCIEREGAGKLVGHNTDRLVGHNTDGAGFLSSLAADGFEPAGGRCVVLGAGGAARAVVLALHRAGAAEVVVVNRDPGRGRRAAELAGSIGTWVETPGVTDALRDADLLVNATPVGMGVGDPSPVAADRLHDGLFVSDLVYSPEVTPLMRAAAEAGARCQGGLGMLVGQAAEAFRIWTGLEPPMSEMAAAAKT